MPANSAYRKSQVYLSMSVRRGLVRGVIRHGVATVLFRYRVTYNDHWRSMISIHWEIRVAAPMQLFTLTRSVGQLKDKLYLKLGTYFGAWIHIAIDRQV